MAIYSFYESKARKRKWGTWCKECNIELVSGDKLMREQLDKINYDFEKQRGKYSDRLEFLETFILNNRNRII